MAATAVETKPLNLDNSEQVFFFSGSTPTYRKVIKRQLSRGNLTNIPTIDIAEIDSSLGTRKKIASQIYDACTTVGFFYLANHGIPEDVQERTFKALRDFFALDLEDKMEVHLHKNPAIRGYEPIRETRLDPRTKGDIKEAFSCGDCPLEPEQRYEEQTGSKPPVQIKRGQNIWPSKAPWLRERIYEYYDAILPVVYKIIRVMALAFDMDENAFDEYFKFPIWGMRGLHYPPTPVEEDGGKGVGLGAHADYSWLTFVLQGTAPGLEVLSRDGVWVDALPKPNTLVCNVGQYLERQTSGKFVATVHRVRNKTGGERYSLPFFLTPDPEAQLRVLNCDVKPGQNPQETGETLDVGRLYIQKLLPARINHPTSIRYRDMPESEWEYGILYG